MPGINHYLKPADSKLSKVSDYQNKDNINEARKLQAARSKVKDNGAKVDGDTQTDTSALQKIANQVSRPFFPHSCH